MTKLFLIGTGGFLGSVSRHLLGSFVYRISGSHWFPYGTLTVNILGCLLIGLLSGICESRQVMTDQMRLFVFVGVLGGFTTFSSFGLETLHLLRATQHAAAFLNVALQVMAGILAVSLGYFAAKFI